MFRLVFAACFVATALAAQGSDPPTFPPTPDGHFLHNFFIRPQQPVGCPVGCKGQEGDFGKAGHRGPRGPPGAAGTPGIPGYFVTYSHGHIPGMPPEGSVLTDQIVYNPYVKGPQGELGDVGPAGPDGIDGQAGQRGRAGRMGRPGRIGEYGEPGLPGLPGDEGPRGEPGVAGTRGPTGYRGVQGEIGRPGAQGSIGFPGPPGLSGDPGLNGLNGDFGPPGLKGSVGDIGQVGQKGAKGAIGSTGANGPQGLMGDRGNDGPAGLQGPKGDAGVSGFNGNRGAKGQAGAKGSRGPYIEKIGVNETVNCESSGRSVVKYDPYVKKLYYCNGNKWQCVESDPCDVDCEVSDWEPWQACSATCGDGLRTRTRRITVAAVKNGRACPGLVETQPCQSQQCFCTPGAISNGRIVDGQAPYVLGDLISWQCDTGYRMAGARVSRCLGSGVFDTFPSCEAIQCPDPGVPENGQRVGVVAGGFTVGIRLNHVCNENFVASGSDTTQCQVDGTWSQPLPICMPLQCSQPAAPANGGRDRESGVVGDVVTYHCNNGYNLRGDTTRTCGASGQWSGSVPTCELVNCGDPGAPQFGFIVQSDGFTFGTDVAVACTAGYQLVGSRTRHCQADGSWSGTSPACNLRACPEVSAPADGEVRLSNAARVVGTVATFTCTEAGHRLTGAERITCESSGAWSQPPPTCQALKCCNPGAPENGAVTEAVEFLAERDNAQYTCNTGYRLQGPGTRFCLVTGWSDPEPTCERITCPDPGVPADGRRLPLFGVFLPGELASFSCEVGFRLSGRESLACQPDGRWSDVPPTCELVVCAAPAVPANGQRIGSDFSFSKSVAFECDENFSLRGPEVRTCQANGLFDGEPAVCDPNCVLSEYGDYSPCSVTCGDGTRARDRNVLQEASGNGRACEPLQEVEVCNLGSCIQCENGQYFVNESAYVTPAGPGGPYAADIVVVIEQTQTLREAFTLIRGFLEEIESSLILQQGIGSSPDLPNMYTIVGFGGDRGTGDECAHYLLQEGTDTAFTFDRVSEVLRTPRLSTQIQSKDGYEAMLFALQSPGLRHSPNIAHNLIFIGNSSRTDTCSGAGDAKEKLRNELVRKGFTANFVLDHRIQLVRDKSEEVLGVRALLINSSRVVYLRQELFDQFATIDPEREQIPVDYTTASFGTVNEDYTQLALSTGGVIWNVNNIMGRHPASSSRRSFTAAFKTIKMQEIETQARSCKLCTCVEANGVGQFHCAQQVDETYCKCREGGSTDGQCQT